VHLYSLRDTISRRDGWQLHGEVGAPHRAGSKPHVATIKRGQLTQDRQPSPLPMMLRVLAFLMRTNSAKSCGFFLAHADCPCLSPHGHALGRGLKPSRRPGRRRVVLHRIGHQVVEHDLVLASIRLQHTGRPPVHSIVMVRSCAAGSAVSIAARATSTD